MRIYIIAAFFTAFISVAFSAPFPLLAQEVPVAETTSETTSGIAPEAAEPEEGVIPEDQIAFGDGEKLTYVVSYRAKLVPNLEAGEVILRTSKTNLDGKPVYNISGNAKVFQEFKWFYDLDDTYQTWLDARTLKPLKYQFRLREGKFRADCNYVYDWPARKVTTYYHNLKRPTGKTRVLPLRDTSFDALALFYNLRSDDINKFISQNNKSLYMVLEDTVRKVNFSFVGREKMTVKRLGTFNTLKFACTIMVSNEESFEDGSQFFIWITDDKNRIPVYLESPLKVGSARVTLTKYQGLKHPLTSKIK